MIFIADVVKELKDKIIAELPDVITELSTVEVPLENPTIHCGFFDPINYSETPAIFIVPNGLKKTGEYDSYNSMNANQNGSIYIVCGATSDDSQLFAEQLYGYIKAVIIFLNNHLDKYDWDDIEIWDQLGIDTSKKWAEIPISIDLDIIIGE